MKTSRATRGVPIGPFTGRLALRSFHHCVAPVSPAASAVIVVIDSDPKTPITTTTTEGREPKVYPDTDEEKGGNQPIDAADLASARSRIVSIAIRSGRQSEPTHGTGIVLAVVCNALSPGAGCSSGTVRIRKAPRKTPGSLPKQMNRGMGRGGHFFAGGLPPTTFFYY